MGTQIPLACDIIHVFLDLLDVSTPLSSDFTVTLSLLCVIMNEKRNMTHRQQQSHSQTTNTSWYIAYVGIFDYFSEAQPLPGGSAWVIATRRRKVVDLRSGFDPRLYVFRDKQINVWRLYTQRKRKLTLCTMLIDVILCPWARHLTPNCFDSSLWASVFTYCI